MKFRSSAWVTSLAGVAVMLLCAACAAPGLANEEAGVPPRVHDIEAVGLTGRTLVVAPQGVAGAAGTEADPLSLQAAADVSAPGDTVLVRAGTYRNRDQPGEMGALLIRNSGTADHWIRYANYPGERPVIEFNSLRGIQIQGASYLLIEGFELDGRNDEIELADAVAHADAFKGEGYDRNAFFGVGIRVATGETDPAQFSHHIILRSNHVHHCSGGGIATARADYLLIENNVIHHCGFYSPWGESGISVWCSANHDDRDDVYRTVIRGNTCFQNDNRVKFWIMNSYSDGNGIILDALQNTQGNLTQDGYEQAYSGRVLVADNVCFFNGGRGVNLYESDRITVVHNTLYENAQRDNIENEIEVGRVHHAEIRFNVIHPGVGKRAIGGYQSAEIRIGENLVAQGQEHPDFAWGPGVVTEPAAFVRAPERVTPGDPAVSWRDIDFTLLATSPGQGWGARR